MRVVKTKALISFAVTAKLICAFVFAYADCWFSHGAAQITMLPHQVSSINCKRRCTRLTSGKHVHVMYTLEPHFYIAKLGYAGVNLFSYFCCKT